MTPARLVDATGDVAPVRLDIASGVSSMAPRPCIVVINPSTAISRQTDTPIRFGRLGLLTKICTSG